VKLGGVITRTISWKSTPGESAGGYYPGCRAAPTHMAMQQVSLAKLMRLALSTVRAANLAFAKEK